MNIMDRIEYRPDSFISLFWLVKYSTVCIGKYIALKCHPQGQFCPRLCFDFYCRVNCNWTIILHDDDEKSGNIYEDEWDVGRNKFLILNIWNTILNISNSIHISRYLKKTNKITIFQYSLRQINSLKKCIHILIKTKNIF